MKFINKNDFITKIYRISQDFIKSRRISEIYQDFKSTEFHRVSWISQVFMKCNTSSCEIHQISLWISWYISLNPTGFHTISWDPTQFY